MVHFYPRLWLLTKKQAKQVESKPSILKSSNTVDRFIQEEEPAYGRSRDAIHQISKTYSLERRTFM